MMEIEDCSACVPRTLVRVGLNDDDNMYACVKVKYAIDAMSLTYSGSPDTMLR